MNELLSIGQFIVLTVSVNQNFGFRFLYNALTDKYKLLYKYDNF